MSSLKKIKSALISVYHKERVDEIVKKLDSLGVKIYSTGGTKSFIEDLGLTVNSVEALTGYPSILGGRVKTLHPKVFGGILARRENDGDIAQLSEYEIPEIDLVIVDLYPFEDTVASGADHADIIEKIDIGGIALIRGAAKNYNDVIIVPSMAQYDDLLTLLDEKKGESDLADREKFALNAFATSSHYDSAIFNYFNQGKEDLLRVSFNSSSVLRYGENPHQRGVFFGKIDDLFDKIHGKEISYNNLLDIDAAVSLIDEFNETTFAILKHNNACGCASRKKLIDAWKDALAGDPVSAFGGVLITNATIDAETATEINKLFFEVVIAPAYDEAALQILESKKNRIILVRKNIEISKTQYRSVLNGVLYQDRDMKKECAKDLTPVTKIQATAAEVEDLLFANKLVKQSKSNTIVLAKNKQLLASGVGETSRVDALKHAIEKAESFGFDMKGSVMSSDAFFPFPDCVEIAYGVGVKSVIHPGGSVRDQDSIDFCNENNMSMVITGTRHFKH
ncbi:MAG TPA: bifunctional phosphoribosylaminoimidazolecarboxamide formyltransferase/IMP cyclohydrolase [Prolixibacteraceae bacterium]|nr:bifunctional phosphoribosylaminoimidazolecarboxamide formyltransferase/IMP cyclohydrolase [Prolixibacteraceae bacterium]